MLWDLLRDALHTYVSRVMSMYILTHAKRLNSISNFSFLLQIFPMIDQSAATPRSDDGSLDVPQLMVRNFEPLGLTEGRKNCI